MHGRYMSLDHMVERLTKENAEHRAVVERFAKNLVENPGFALSWGQNPVDTIGELEVNAEVLRLVEMMRKKDEPDDLIWETLRLRAMTEILGGARHPHNSTSIMDIAMRNATTRGWVVLYEKITS
jgi:hypothetical protein